MPAPASAGTGATTEPDGCRRRTRRWDRRGHVGHGHDGRRALLDGLVPTVLVQIGGGIARVHGVAAQMGQRLGVLRGHHVEGGLRRRVHRADDARLEPVRVGGGGHRSHAARHHDDPGVRRALEQREHGPGDAHRAEQVHREARRAVLGPGLERSDPSPGDPRAVREHVQGAERFERGERRGHRCSGRRLGRSPSCPVPGRAAETSFAPTGRPRHDPRPRRLRAGRAIAPGARAALPAPNHRA